MTRSTMAFLAVLSLTVLVLLLMLWSDVPEQESEARWLCVEPQLLESRLNLVGRIQAANQVTLAAPFEGLIAQVHAQEGQRVARGQILLTLDPTQLEIRLRRAQAELLKAQRVEQQLQHWQSGTQMARARRTVSSARLLLNTTQANLRDTQTLFERGIVARMEVDTLRQQVQAQTLDLAAAEEELQLTSAQGQGEDRSIARMELTNALAHVEALEGLHRNKDILAPIAGLVVRPPTGEEGKPREVLVGQQVAEGTALLKLVELTRLQVLTKIEETDLHLVREGMAVEITGDGFVGQALEGRVSSVGLQSSAGESHGAGAWYDLLVTIDSPVDKPGQGIRLGMSAQLSILLHRNEQGIAVPAEALRDDGNGASLVTFRPTPDAPSREVAVSLGRPVLQGVEVEGLEPGCVQLP